MSFPTRSIPNNVIPEPTVSKAGESDAELNEICSTIEYVVFKNEDTPALIKHKQFTYDPTDLDADFSCIYDRFATRRLQILLFSPQFKKRCIIRFNFSFDSISDTFYEMISLNIDVAEITNKDVSLQRIVSRIEFMATDSVSDILKQFDMEIDGISNQLDIATGQGIKNPDKQILSYTFKNNEIGEVNKVHSFYTFIPPTDNKIAVRLSAIAKNDEPIRERQIDNIIPEKNKIIRYKGRLYSRSESDDTFQISIYNNGKWEETTDIELPDYE